MVTISRVSGSVTYSASFMLVPAMNPCPCGYYTHPTKERSCSPSTITRYQKRISGPLLDRVDVFVEVPAVEYEKLVEDQQSEDPTRPRLRVEEAREIQGARFKECGFFCNSEMGPAEVWKYCPLDDSAKGLLRTATQRLNLLARAFHRIFKVSRTIADLEPLRASISPIWPRPCSTGRGRQLAESGIRLVFFPEFHQSCLHHNSLSVQPNKTPRQMRRGVYISRLVVGDRA